MNDAGLLIKNSLLTTSLTSVVGTGSAARLWPYRTKPVPGYKPSDGVGIGFNIRGGQPMYHDGLMFPSVQFKIWGIDEKVANQGYLALMDVLHDKSPGSIRSATCDILGQTSQEPDTQWVFVLTFFTIGLIR